MALPAALSLISPSLAKAGVHFGAAGGPESEGLPLGLEALDRVLPDGGLLLGGVVELSVAGASGLGTFIALNAVRAFQGEHQGTLAGHTASWCAFVDASSSLYAPGVLGTGVNLERLLVVRPPLEAIGRVAIKLAESQVFSLVVVDTAGTLGRPLGLSLGSFGRVVRRLAMAVDGTRHSVLLLTDAAEPRSLPLPVAQRIELARPQVDRLVVRVAKDRRGRVGTARSVSLARGVQPGATGDARKLA